jgi:hypothetical protein
MLYAVKLDECDLPFMMIEAASEEEARIQAAERTGVYSLDLVAELAE